MLMISLAVAAALVAAQDPSPAKASVERHAIEGSSFPISEAVTVRAGTDLVFLSGVVPRPASVSEEGAPEWGDTEAQTVSVLKGIEERLARRGLDLGDVVMMRAYLVGDPATGTMDFAGFMRGYTQFFGTQAQPNLPSRSAFQIAGLAVPGWLVEIAVVAAAD